MGGVQQLEMKIENIKNVLDAGSDKSNAWKWTKHVSVCRGLRVCM